MRVLRQKSFSKKEEKEKDKKKAKIASGIAAGTGVASAGSLVSSKKLIDKSDKVADKLFEEDYRNLRGKRVAKKVGGIYNSETGAVVNPHLRGKEYIEFPNYEGNKILERHNKYVINKAIKLENKGRLLGGAGIALGAASLGTGAYAMKKLKDSKKDDNSKK